MNKLIMLVVALCMALGIVVSPAVAQTAQASRTVELCYYNDFNKNGIRNTPSEYMMSSSTQIDVVLDNPSTGYYAHYTPNLQPGGCWSVNNVPDTGVRVTHRVNITGYCMFSQWVVPYFWNVASVFYALPNNTNWTHTAGANICI